MSRSRMIRRENKRALAFGIGLSLAAHAAVFAFVRMDIASLERTVPTITILEADSPPLMEPEALELVELRFTEAAPLSPVPLASARAGSAAPAAAASLPSAAPATASLDAAVHPTLSIAEQTYDQLVVLEPIRNVVVEPVPFDELTVAETTPSAQPDEAEVPVYVPGSIGKAKRGWASENDGEARTGTGVAWTFGPGGRGDGHCPMPGKGGRVPPPLWTRGTILR
jgi:hypothetical protein